MSGAHSGRAASACKDVTQESASSWLTQGMLVFDSVDKPEIDKPEEDEQLEDKGLPPQAAIVAQQSALIPASNEAAQQPMPSTSSTEHLMDSQLELLERDLARVDAVLLRVFVHARRTAAPRALVLADARPPPLCSSSGGTLALAVADARSPTLLALVDEQQASNDKEKVLETTLARVISSRERAEQVLQETQKHLSDVIHEHALLSQRISSMEQELEKARAAVDLWQDHAKQNASVFLNSMSRDSQLLRAEQLLNAGFCGIGITMGQGTTGDGKVVVKHIVPGGAVDRLAVEMSEDNTRSGLERVLLPKVGDILLAIDGKAVVDVATTPRFIMGLENTPVSLLVGRQDEAGTVTPVFSTTVTRCFPTANRKMPTPASSRASIRPDCLAQVSTSGVSARHWMPRSCF